MKITRNAYLALSILLIFFSRFLFLSADSAPYSETLLGSKDEQEYNKVAINLYHHNQINPTIVDSIKADGDIALIFQNVCQVISMKILGNNYYGFRLASVIFSVLVFLLLFLLLEKYYLFKSHIKLYLVLLFFFLFDFMLIAIGKNAAPPISRLFVTVCVLYVLHIINSNEKHQLIKYLIFGVFVIFTLFFNYLTNMFLVAFVYIFLLVSFIIHKWNKRYIWNGLFFSLGIVLGLVIIDICFRLIANLSLFDYLSFLIKSFGGRVSVNGGNSLPGKTSIVGIVILMAKKIIYLVHAKSFMLNLSILYLAIILLPISIVKIIKEKSILQIILISLLLSFFFQALFYYPHATKWTTVIYPIVLLFVFVNVIDFKGVYDSMSECCAKWYTYISLTILLGFIVLLKTSKVYIHPAENAVGSMIIIYNLLVAGIIFYLLFRNLNNFKITFIYAILIFGMLPNVYYSTRYFFTNPQYNYREALITLNNRIGNNVVAGGWSHGFRLYTEGNNIVSWYSNQDDINKYRQKLTSIFDNGFTNYTIDYTKRDYIDVFKDIDTINKNYTLKIDTTLYLGRAPEVGCDSIILVKRVVKNN